ncbi:abscission/NoCut checkpoint regulator isoform X2 [Rhinoderma darwinii]|uniref:abscission/NoCut checkpoint regulator isoform X2 n=1 Tax=Rhinoderma darwinii TaxID=43563 RepID=UPI003F67BD74
MNRSITASGLHCPAFRAVRGKEHFLKVVGLILQWRGGLSGRPRTSHRDCGHYVIARSAALQYCRCIYLTGDMDGRCFGCASKFSIFKKECGCKSCRHSFCAGCLAFTAVLPAHGNTKQKVCKKCHDNISNPVAQRNNSSKWSPPENYKKRIAALEAKQSQREEMQRGQGVLPIGSNSRYQGLSPEDQAISERLEKLKRETKPKAIPSTAEIESRIEALRKETQAPAPSLEEMECRLAVLQGRVPPSRATKPPHQSPDTRSQTQKVDDLLTQLNHEVALDQKCDPDSQQELPSPPINDRSKADHEDRWTGLYTELDAAQLEKEKDKILNEAATELQEENTRQEKMLEIGKRLAVLQGRDPDKVTMDNYKLPDSDEETEEEVVQRCLKQLSEEAFLDEASGYNDLSAENTATSNGKETKPGNKLPPKQTAAAQIQPARSSAGKVKEADSDEEELPWCCICNEDCALRCHDCDGDLYCKKCFREGHDEFDRKEHQTSVYRRPRKKKGR